MVSHANPYCSSEEVIEKAAKLAEKMLMIAEKGIPTCQEDGCMVILGVIRDCGYKIRRTIEQDKVCNRPENGKSWVLN
jgi:hypothetical protein